MATVTREQAIDQAGMAYAIALRALAARRAAAAKDLPVPPPAEPQRTAA